MEKQIAHASAVKSTGLVWVVFVLLFLSGALIRLATQPNQPDVAKEADSEQSSVLIQQPVEEVENPISQSTPKTPLPPPPDNPGSPLHGKHSESADAQIPVAIAQLNVPGDREPAEKGTKIDGMRDSANSGPSFGLDELRAQIEVIRQQSDFRRKLSYYTDIGMSLPEIQRRWARVDIQIDDVYWQASAAFGVRFIFMAGDFDEQNASLVFDLNSGTADRVAPTVFSERPWFVRELLGDAERVRSARHTAAARLGLARPDDVRVYSLIPENVWLAQLGKIEDVLVRRQLHLGDVARVHVGYEKRGSDFDFVVRSIVRRDGHEEIIL